MKSLNITIFIIMTIVLTFGCQEDEVFIPNMLYDFVLEPVGDNCISGGYKFINGLDQNDNGLLDEDEIDKTEYLCNYNSDKEIRLSFNGAFYTTESTEWELAGDLALIKNFDVRNYSNLNSIVFMATVRVQSGDENNTSHARLYNITDGESIPNSEVESQDRSLVWKITDNILSYIPEKKIDIGIELKSSNGSGWVQVSTPYLILYKD